MYTKGQTLVNEYNGKIVVLKDIQMIAGIKTFICTKPYDDDEEIHLYEEDLREVDNGRVYL